MSDFYVDITRLKGGKKKQQATIPQEAESEER